MTKRRARKALLAILASLLAGCNAMIAGQWRSIEPAAVPPDVPRVREITFRADGRFDGRMTRHNHTTAVGGTFRFDGIELVLDLEGSGGGKFVYSVQSIGNVLLLTQNQVTNRLCREPAGAAPAAPPALPEEPAEAPLIAVPDAHGLSALATQRAPASQPAAMRPSR